jgi:hypothetical protein
VSKRIAIFILILLLIPAIAQAQISQQEVRLSPGGDLVTVTFQPIKSATCTKWLDTSQWASDTHTLTFTYRTAPSGITVTMKTSQDGGTTTATTDTSTSITGATLQRTGTTANAIQACVSGLTGSVNMAAVYRGTSSSGSITVSAIVPGTGATNLGKAIDDPTGATATGVLSLCTRDDSLSTLTPAEGDNVQCRVDSTGAEHVRISNLVTDTADNAPFTEAPIGIGGMYAAAPSDHTDGDKATILTDIKGRVITVGRDPCSSGAKVFVSIDIVTATTTEVINADASNMAYICSIILFTDAANDVALVEDATDACASPSAGLMGGVTAAEGFNFGATQGFVASGGNSTITKTSATNINVCLITSAATQLNGTISYVLAP